MSVSFIDRLKAGETLVADGATATNYQQMGMAIGVAPEAWLFDEPAKVMALHRGFIEAGSDIILTDTFGATPLRLRESSDAGRTAEVKPLAVKMAGEAGAGRP